MSNTAKKTYSREQLMECIKCYHEFKLKISQVGHIHTGVLPPAASTAKYGIEATMPKAQGKPSDPTFNQAMFGDTGYHPEKYLDKMTDAVALVDKLYKRLENGLLKDRMLLDMWCAGLTEKEMASELKVSQPTVNQMKSKLLKVMGE